MNRLGVGIIGLGVGARHAEAYAERADCRIVALCDLSQEKLAEIGAQHPQAARTIDALELLRNPAIDVVSIASYDDQHADQVVEALDRGKHVFVEKPLCLNRAEYARIKSALDRSPSLRLSSNLVLRKSPRFLELRDLIRDGALGEVYYAEGDYLYGRIEKLRQGWRGAIDGYSVMHGGGIHLIDLLQWLTGSTVSAVCAVGNAVAARGSQFRYNDMVAALLNFDRGAIGKVTANFGCVHPHFHGLALYGTKATYVNRPDSALLYTSRDPNVEPRRIVTQYLPAHKGDLIGSFLDSIHGSRPADVPAADVLRAMAVSLAIDEAVLRGGRVNVDELA